MGRIIIEIPEDFEETIKVEKEEDFERAINDIKKKLKRLQLRKKLDNLIGSFEIEEEITEDELYSRGKYE